MPSPPIWKYPLSAARVAVREGISAEQAYLVLHSLGMQVDKQQFDRLYGQAERAFQMIGPSSAWPHDQMPTTDIIQDLSTVTSEGYLYQMNVSVVDKGTGLERQIPYSIRTPEPIMPSEAIDAALVSQRLRQKQYEFEVLDAEVTGFFRLVPEAT